MKVHKANLQKEISLEQKRPITSYDHPYRLLSYCVSQMIGHYEGVQGALNLQTPNMIQSTKRFIFFQFLWACAHANAMIEQSNHLVMFPGQFGSYGIVIPLHSTH